MEFRNVMGHDKQKEMLASLVSKGRMPHALLFAGPEGVGKKIMAVELVKNFFCETGTACGVCRPCRNLSSGSHPDFTLVSKETAIKIDELRAIRRDVYESPFEAPIRVIVIDNADMMTREAANALLKTLEEPPASNLFILISSREQDVPLTIRSRCMRIPFGTLSCEKVIGYLRDVRDVETGQAELLARLSNGSISGALFWLDEEHFALRRRVAELVTGRTKGFANIALVAEAITAGGNELTHLSFLLSLLRDIWWVAVTRDAAGVANIDLAEIVEETSSGRQAWAGRSIRRVQEALRTLRYNVNRWLAVEHLMIDIVRAS
jgi:DNA polymerase III subunit delta'